MYELLYFPLLKALLIIIVGYIVVKMLESGVLRRISVLGKEQIDILTTLVSATKYVLYIIILLIALSSVGIDVWPLIASLGIGGLALSMAMKDTVTDYISGLTIILGRSIKKGDKIFVKDKGVEGVVEEVGWRYTVLRTEDGKLVTVPNRVMSSSVIIFEK